ncbi:MAG TPA: hypothetical protein QF353_03345 [Gammaproteobacteria bacterium]|nr:hypothetical protein [Gammaproteobacteria bacterium]
MKNNLLLMTMLICSTAYPIGKSITVDNRTPEFVKFNLYGCPKELENNQQCRLLVTQYLQSYNTAQMSTPWYDLNKIYVIEAHIDTSSHHHKFSRLVNLDYLAFCTASVTKLSTNNYEMRARYCDV